MKLHFLGTGAADWDISKANASPDFRRHSSMLIDGCLLVDPGVPEMQIQRAIAEKTVRAVLLTHAHFDHMMSVQPFVDAGATLYVGALDVTALTDERLNLCGMIAQHLSIQAKPVALRGGDAVEEAGVRLEVIETPGHTPGGVCYYEKRVAKEVQI